MFNSILTLAILACGTLPSYGVEFIAENFIAKRRQKCAKQK